SRVLFGVELERMERDGEGRTVARLILALLLSVTAIRVACADAGAPDPFAFFQPTVVLTPAERKQLERGDPLTRVIPGHDREVAVFAAMKTTIDGDRLLQWVERPEQLKKSPYVLAIARLSETPRLDDFRALTLDDDEASDILDCRPGDCSMKLSGDEMRTLQQAAMAKGGDTPAGTEALGTAFPSVMLRRVEGYLSHGIPGVPVDESTSEPLKPADTLGALLNHSQFLSTHAPDFAGYLARFPHDRMQGVDSFVYWSK